MPHYCVQYAVVYDPLGREPNAMPVSNKANGRVSEKSAKRIKDAMNWLMFFSKRKYVFSKEKGKGFYFKLNFITLTLSSAQMHSDSYIVNHMLQPFLRWLQRSHGVVNYIWKAEAQENGNIHFHITTNKFIHYKSIAGKWDELQLSHNYITVDEHAQFKSQSPSTQIKSVVQDKAIVGYMTKYISKGIEERKSCSSKKALEFVACGVEAELAYASICSVGMPFVKRSVTCKVWGCNYSLSRINCTLTETNCDFWREKQIFTDNFCDHVRSEKYYTMWFTRIKSSLWLSDAVTDQLKKAYEMFMTNDDGVSKYVM
jgi:hypothetical protein